MKILIDINHPAHVHLLKNFAFEMQKKGHQILFTCRDKEFEIELLESLRFEYINFGKKFSSLSGKILGLFKFNVKLLRIALKFKPDILLSSGSIYASHVSFLIRKPHISLEDTGNIEQVRLYLPFTDVVLTSETFQEDYGSKQIRYPGYHEVAYLNKNYFTPDPSILKKLGIKNEDKFVVIRFISWKATHDVGVRGLSYEDKISIVNKLSEKFIVFISSEGDLPKELENFRININAIDMHSVLYYSSLLFGESGTMTSECFILGTPAVQISGLPKGSMGTLEAQHNSGLVWIYEKYDDDILNHVISLIETDKSKEIWKKKRDQVLSEFIDLTQFLVWFVECYPSSFNAIKKDNNFIRQFLNN